MMVLSVPNLLSELGNVNMYLLSRPAECVCDKHNESLSVLSAEELAKLTNLLQVRVFREGVQGELEE
jgi:hypothetical protein